jgi:N-acetylmuramic acid 6-phosphate etherase
METLDSIERHDAAGTAVDLSGMTTERENPASADIDSRSTRDILGIINAEDKKVPLAVGKALDHIAALVDDVVASFRKGGKLVYIGAGTSGRLGVLDASECPPTYGTPPSMVQGLIAGGREALVRSVEWAEDKEDQGVKDLDAIDFTGRDVLVGITASGQAPYVLGAMRRAKALGAVVGAISCNANSGTFGLADHRIFVDVGPEVVTGSTRMKSGTAQKLVLNMITTTAMIRLGKVYRNLMIDLTPVNKKLVERSKNLIMKATDCDRETAEKAFAASGRKPKIAIVMVLLGIDAAQAEQLVASNDGHLSRAIEAYKAGRA